MVQQQQSIASLDGDISIADLDDAASLATFNDESSLDSLGIVKTVAPEELPIPKVCNLFGWLRMILDVYEKEVKMRKAAIRVMFETATTGALTDDMPLGESMKKVLLNLSEEEEVRPLASERSNGLFEYPQGQPQGPSNTS